MPSFSFLPQTIHSQITKIYINGAEFDFFFHFFFNFKLNYIKINDKWVFPEFLKIFSIFQNVYAYNLYNKLGACLLNGHDLDFKNLLIIINLFYSWRNLVKYNWFMDKTTYLLKSLFLIFCETFHKNRYLIFSFFRQFKLLDVYNIYQPSFPKKSTI